MGITRQYILNVDVESEDEIEPMEELLQEILLDLYDTGGVEKIHVIDNNSNLDNDEDLHELIDILNQIESREVMRSIELVREMEDDDDE